MRAHVGAYMARRIDRTKSFGPTGIVGPGNRLRRGVLRPIRQRKGLRSSPILYATIHFDFLHVRLSFSEGMQATWQLKKHRIKACERARVNLMHFGPPNLDHT